MNQPENSVVRRQDLLDALKDVLEMNVADGCRFFSLYGDSGTGKSQLAYQIRETMGLGGSDFTVLTLDASKGVCAYPETGLLNLRNSVSHSISDYFALYDICMLVRNERIHGKLLKDADKFYTNPSLTVREIIKSSDTPAHFTRHMYDEVGKSIPASWFNEVVRPYISSMFVNANQKNWVALLEAFAECLKSMKTSSGLEPILIIDNADALYSSFGSGMSWIKFLVEKAGCGTVIYISEDKLPLGKYGNIGLEVHVEGFSQEQSEKICHMHGIEREALVSLIYENVSGQPALTAFSAETYSLMKKSEGVEPDPDIFESDPMNIVHMHLSSMNSTDSVLAKLLSAADYFDEHVFEAVAQEFAQDALDFDNSFDIFVNRTFIETLGGGNYRIHPLYRKFGYTTLDSDLVENINYCLFRHHMNIAENAAVWESQAIHIKNAVKHAMAVMEIDGFVNWFSGLEKSFYNVEFFNFWLDMLEVSKKHISGILGASHHDVSSYFDKLAFMYLKSGRSDAAESVLQERLDAVAERDGKDSGESAASMNKLASLYSKSGDFNAAEAVMKKALTINEQRFTKKSFEYADSMMKLGEIEMNAGKRDDAVKHIDEAQEIFNKVSDVNEPARLEADEVMASVYSAAGHLAKAALLYHKITSAKNEQLGPYSKDALRSLSDYAQVVFKNGNGKKAAKLYEDLMAKTKKIYGEHSRMTASAVNDLAVVYQKINEYEKSETLHTEAISIKTHVYGTNHPSTAASFTNFGQLKYVMGDLQNAEPYYFKALQIYETVFGSMHERTALGFNNMGFITSRMGQFDRAEAYYKKALEIKQEVGGEKTVSAAATMNNLGELLYRLGKKDEAREFLTKAHSIYSEILGDEHEYTKLVDKNLQAV